MKDSGDFAMRAIVCPPVDATDYGVLRRAMYEATIRRAGRAPYYYPGSVVGTCSECGIKVFIGPGQRQAITDWAADGLEHRVLCLVCAAVVATQDNVEVELRAGDNANGIPMTEVNVHPEADGYTVACSGCGRTGKMPDDPGDVAALCPDCLAKGTTPLGVVVDRFIEGAE